MFTFNNIIYLPTYILDLPVMYSNLISVNIHLSNLPILLMGGLAMLAPVQGGIGPWHFMVYETLFIYGIDKADGKIFALIAHATTNLIYLIFGLLALLIIPFVNASEKK